jgi:hypothetical protein
VSQCVTSEIAVSSEFFSTIGTIVRFDVRVSQQVSFQIRSLIE